jgi:hypothetical protein
MTDLKFQELTSNNTPALSDIFPYVKDPAGTPLDRKSTFDGLRTTFRGYAAKTGNYTVTVADRFLGCDATGGAITITLPAAADMPVGFTLIVKKVDSSANAVIIDANSAETIDGATTQILFTQYASVTLVNTGTAWLIADQNGLTSGLIYQTNAGVTLANDTNETTLISATGSGTLTLPANFFRVGKMYRLTAMGFISTTSTPTLNLRKKLGSTTLAATGAVTLGNNLANALLLIDLLLTCRSVGGSGTVIVSGMAGLGAAVANLYPTSGAPVTIDTGVSQAINLTGQWGTANASNTLTIPNLAISRLN